MNRTLTLLLATVFICLLLLPTKSIAQVSISIDHVDSLYNGKVQPDQPLKFHIRWTNNSGFDLRGGIPGYRVYLSNNGELSNGVFETVVLDTLPLGFPMLFDLVFSIVHFSDGIGADTVSFGGSILFGPGYPDGTDEILGFITTSVSSDFAGDSLCIDSSFNGSAGIWKFSSTGGDFTPEWSGPYCYEILPSCCIGKRGNMNNSPDDQIDVSDINILINYMFLMGVAPTCLDEGDFNGDGSIDVSDLVAMVDYMFLLGLPPADCM